MDVSIVIPLYNCLELTQRCLESLQATLPARLNYEIILVDDGSTDGTREWLSTLSPPVRVLLNEKNLGYAAANNRAAVLASAPLLVFSNNDVIFSQGWLSPLLTVHRHLGARAGVIGNVQRNAHTGRVDHAGIFFDHRGKAQHIRSVPWRRWLSRAARAHPPAVTGACFAISRALWNELGGFDAGYVNGAEDVDLCLRARAGGYVNAVALRSVIRHHISSSPGRKIRDEVNSYRFTKRWRNSVVQLAQRDTGRFFLRKNWLGSRNPEEFIVAAAMLLFEWRAIARPPLELQTLADAAVRRELSRWEMMFDENPKELREAKSAPALDPTLV